MSREEQVNIHTNDGKIIYGKLIDDSSKPLIILSHGLTDNMDSREMFNAAWHLADQGFSTYRFSYYDGLENARNIVKCTLETHAQDLDTVIEYFRSKTSRQLYVIGHSFGGLTIFLSGCNFDGAVFWDPSHPDSGLFSGAKYYKEQDCYIIDWGVDYLVGSRMVEHFRELNIKKVLEKYDKPTLIVSAGKGVHAKTNRLYFEYIKNSKELLEIEAADHNFSNEDTFDELMAVTTKWLKDRASSNPVF